ncbi:hypothetical protein [Enterococcus alishanensis]
MTEITRPETIEKLNEVILAKVFSQFKGMDVEYKAIIAKYRKAVQSNQYNPDYLQQLRKESLKAIHELMTNRKALADAELTVIQGMYDIDKDKKPTDVGLAAGDQLLLETQRNNALKLIDAKVDSSKDLKVTYLELYELYKNDEFLLSYMDALSEKIPETEKVLIQKSIDEINSNPFENEINKIRLSLVTLLSEKTTFYPSYLENGIHAKNKYVLRNFSADLDLNDRIKEGWKNSYNTDQSEGK